MQNKKTNLSRKKKILEIILRFGMKLIECIFVLFYAESDTQVEIKTMMQFGYSHMPILESEESIKCIHCLNNCLFILFNWTTKHIKYNMVIVFYTTWDTQLKWMLLNADTSAFAYGVCEWSNI